MSNTITDTTLSQSKLQVTKYVTLASDGTNETSTVIYDSSVIATAVGDTDPLTCTLLSMYASASTASTARIAILWDASTKVLAMDVPPGQSPTFVDFRRIMPIGGLKNQGGSGITGDILITTTGLASGDKITLVFEVKRN